LAEFSSQFEKHAPELASVELLRARVGVLTGNGNHCDFIVDVQVSGELPAQDIIDHYESIPIKRAVAGESTDIQMDITQTGTNRFTLTVTDAPNEAAFDMRCI